MLNQPEPACLVIADISGYTGFLAGAELDHAQDVLADLMSTVVAALRPTFRLAKLEGDAAFVFAMTETVDGPQLQDTIERCYFSFRRRLRDIGQASACECNACVLVPKLDLKFVAHFGRIVRQRVASRDELFGSDVIVVHRLLKNHVAETTGFMAYALYTDACLAAMDLAEPAAAGLVEHREEFDGVGEIGSWARDLHAAWTDEQRRASIIVAPKDAFSTYETIVAAPPAVAWEWATSPIRRPRWQYGVEIVLPQGGAPGRRGTGTVNHCIHGKEMIIEEVLDWQPFEHVSYRSLLPIPNVPKLVNTFLFEDLADGRTRVEVRVARLRNARELAIEEAIRAGLDHTFNEGLSALTRVIDEFNASRADVPVEPEPAVPGSLGRNIREPIASGAGRPG
jgi:uncharacterized protein YndB with AHSA1/START domain